MRIRRAKPDDAPAIARVLRVSFLEFEPLYTPAAFAATVPSVDELRKRFPEGPVWVAETDVGIVGTVAAVVEQDGLYVRSMAILPAARGRAIGRRLMAHVEDYATANGLPRMFLSTTPFLTRAIRLYEHLGFCRTDKGPHDLCGTPLFIMEKVL